MTSARKNLELSFLRNYFVSDYSLLSCLEVQKLENIMKFWGAVWFCLCRSAWSMERLRCTLMLELHMECPGAVWVSG